MFNKSVSEDFEQARKDFNYALEELVTPSQHIIGALSMLCDENSRYATVYVECIVKRIRKVDRDLKLPSIYLIDSVIKNAPHYRKLFEPEIVSVMGEAYRCVDERTKLLILKVRQTWNGIFSADILNRLDAVLRPHTAKNGLPSSKSSIYINPDFGKSSTRNFDRLSRPLGPPSTRQAHKISPSRLSKKERDTRHFSGSRSKQLELEGALLADKDKVGYKGSHSVFGVTPSEENFDPADKKIEYEKNILKRETEELTKMIQEQLRQGSLGPAERQVLLQELDKITTATHRTENLHSDYTLSSSNDGLRASLFVDEAVAKQPRLSQDVQFSPHPSMAPLDDRGRPLIERFERQEAPPARQFLNMGQQPFLSHVEAEAASLQEPFGLQPHSLYRILDNLYESTGDANFPLNIPPGQLATLTGADSAAYPPLLIPPQPPQLPFPHTFGSLVQGSAAVPTGSVSGFTPYIDSLPDNTLSGPNFISVIKTPIYYSHQQMLKVGEAIDLINLCNPRTLTKRYESAIQSLYDDFSKQCSSCGLRFKEGSSHRLTEHMDWHFRVNKAEREKHLKVSSRRWFLSEENWIAFTEVTSRKEIESANTFFEDSSTKKEIIVQVSCPASEGSICEVCGEKFERFWNEEKEDWHFNNAVRVEDRVYHYLCAENEKSQKGS